MKASSVPDNVRVICRIRPMNEMEFEQCSAYDALSRNCCVEFNKKDHKSIVVFTPLEKADRDKEPFDKHIFNFDYVFPCESKQCEVYDIAASPILEGVLEGFNGCILAYGQTSSGKTFTMQGDLDDIDVKGIIPRIVDTLFERIDSAGSKIEFTIKSGMIEIYNEKLKDLLDPTNDKLNVREEKQKGVYIDNLTEYSITSADEIYELMKQGNSNRAVGCTNMNAQSSRSHSIFIIHLTINDLENFSCKTGNLHLVDLAGSEVISKTGATGKTLEEAKNINKSLTVLGRVINALTDGKSDYIPYRDSKLTRILQNSLGGNSKTCLIITASPSIYNASETLSTCRFGMRAKNIKNKAIVNKIPTIAELQLIINQLRIEIAKNNRRIAHLEAMIKNLGGKIPSNKIMTNPSENENENKNENECESQPQPPVVKPNPNNLEILPEPDKDKEKIKKAYGEDVDSLIDQLRKERERTKMKAEDIKSVKGRLEERISEIERLKKLIADKEELNSERQNDKGFMEGVEAQDERILRKSYTQENHMQLIKEEKEKHITETNTLVSNLAALTMKHLELMQENERLIDKHQKMNDMNSSTRSKDYMEKLKNNLCHLNQMYHQKLNQDAIIRYDYELQKNNLQYVKKENDAMHTAIVTMKNKINELVTQCGILKETIRSKLSDGSKILEDPEFTKVDPIFVSKQNVLKKIRGGKGLSKDPISMVLSKSGF